MLSTDTLGRINGSTTSTAAASGASSTNEAGSADRFLRLLVAQMQNQDPLNPMDNAQVTSQMAQINTVSGIERLNNTVGTLNAQFVQLQALQGASLVGRTVSLPGDELQIQDGVGRADFELSGTASRVSVEVLNPAGRVVDTLNLGAQNVGRHSIVWNAPTGVADGEAYHFRVSASSGAAAIPTTSLMRDQVQAVGLVGEQLMLQTQRHGAVAYSAVRAIAQ